MRAVHILGSLVIFGLGNHVGMGQDDLKLKMIRDDPKTWVCNGKLLNKGEAITKPVSYCYHRAGVCKNMCFFQHVGMINEAFKFDENKAKILFGIVLPDAKDADNLLIKIKECGEKLVSNDTALDCSGNVEFFRCGRTAMARVCNISEDSFGFMPENQGRSVGEIGGEPGYDFLNKSLARSISKEIFDGSAQLGQPK